MAGEERSSPVLFWWVWWGFLFVGFFWELVGFGFFLVAEKGSLNLAFLLLFLLKQKKFLSA